jgi:hypothetical protein
MTSAKHDLREVLAERFGEELVPLEEAQPVNGQATSRARFIATLHALIAYLQAHPAIPVPWACAINVHADSVEHLAAIGAELGIAPYPLDGQGQQINVFDPLGQEGDAEFYTPIAISVSDDQAERNRPL